MSLAGKRVFITGGSRGIGLEIAKRIAKDGAMIAIAAKTADPNPKLPGTIYTAAQEIEAAGGTPLPLVTDIRDENAIADAVSKAESEAEDLLNAKKREVSTITSNAKREAERMVLTATTEVSEYRNWLSGVISEAERLYRIQTQSLDAAENAISQSRQRLESAFTRLSELQKQVLSAISADGTPSGDARVTQRIVQATANAEAGAAKTATRKTGKKSGAAKKSSSKKRR